MAIQRIRLEQISSDDTQYSNFRQQFHASVVSSGTTSGGTVVNYQEFTAADGETDFTLGYTYTVGSNKLRAFVNGMIQRLGDQYSYIEVDSSTVRFNDPLSAGDWVMFRIES